MTRQRQEAIGLAVGLLLLLAFIAGVIWGPKMSQKDIDDTIIIKSVLGL